MKRLVSFFAAAVLVTLLVSGSTAPGGTAQQSPPGAETTPEPGVPQLAAILAFQLPVMLGLPLAIGWFIKRRFGIGWAAFGWGAGGRGPNACGLELLGRAGCGGGWRGGSRGRTCGLCLLLVVGDPPVA
jgi:hypothetical protein